MDATGAQAEAVDASGAEVARVDPFPDCDWTTFWAVTAGTRFRAAEAAEAAEAAGVGLTCAAPAPRRRWRKE